MSAAGHALTPAMRRVLDLLAAAEDGRGSEDAYEPEIVREGLSCWIGCERTSSATVDRLLAYLLVRDVSEEGGLQRFALSDAGRVARHRPAILGEIAEALHSGTPFSVVDDRVVPLSKLTP